MRKAILPLLLLAGLVGGYYWLNYVDGAQDWWRANVGWPLSDEPTGTISVSGSGTIEVESVSIASETGGRVIAVSVEEGDVVAAGQVLVTLDDSLLLAQREQARAAVESARANLASVSATARRETVAAAEAELTQAERLRDGAGAVAAQAWARVTQPLEIDARIVEAQGNVAVLQKEVEAAQAALNQAVIVRDEAGRDQSSDLAVTTYQAYAKQAEAAQYGLSATQVELQGARQQLALLQAMRENPVSLAVEATAAQSAYAEAEAAVNLAAARVAAAQAAATPEELAVAEAQLAQAEAAAARVEVLLAKSALVSPIDGTVLLSAVKPGEVAAAGSTLLTIADMDNVTLTVYVAESEIGWVQVGAPATVTVDAYPNESFAGTVSYIAMEAEFTPKNVQTKEERTNLVFAVRIDLANGDHRLKAGMPADAALQIVPPALAAATLTDTPTVTDSEATPAGAIATVIAVPSLAPSVTPETQPSPSGGAPIHETATAVATPAADMSQSATVPAASPSQSGEESPSPQVVADATPVPLASPSSPDRCADTMSLLWSWRGAGEAGLVIQGTVTNYGAETLPVILRFEPRDGLGQAVGTDTVVAFSIAPDEAHTFAAQSEVPTGFAYVELADVSCR